MLAKQYRLTKKEDWANVMKNGFFLRGGIVAMKVVKSGLEKNRVGFLVRSKGKRQSVVRNKIKRRLSAAVSPFLKDFRKGLDIVVIADEHALGPKFEELRTALRDLLRNARVIPSP